MTTEIDRLLVRVEANAQQFEAAMRKLNRTLYGTQAETRKTLDRMKRDFDRAAQYLATNNPTFAKGSLLKAIRAAEQAEQALRLLQPKFVEPSAFKARGE